MAVEPIKTLADLLIALFNERKRHKTAIFENHMTPCYDAAKSVFDDYMDYYNALEQKLASEESLEDILTFVKSRRLERLSYREELRAAFSEDNSTKLEPFDAAVLDLVSGSQSVNHEFQYFRYDIELFIRKKDRRLNEKKLREKHIITAQHQAEHITLKYRQIAKEYTNARSKISER